MSIFLSDDRIFKVYSYLVVKVVTYLSYIVKWFSRVDQEKLDCFTNGSPTPMRWEVSLVLKFGSLFVALQVAHELTI